MKRNPLLAMLAGFAVLLALSLTGCGDDSADGPEAQPEAQGESFEFGELREGDRATYRVTVAVPGRGSQTGRALMRTEGTERIGGRQYHRVVMTFEGVPAPTQTMYQRIGEDGVYTLMNRSQPDSEYLEVPLPIRTGMSWTSDTPHGTLQARAVAIESVNVGDETYDDCLKIQLNGRQQGQPVSGTQYHAPKLGLVRQEMDMGPGSMTMELQSYGGALPSELTPAQIKREIYRVPEHEPPNEERANQALTEALNAFNQRDAFAAARYRALQHYRTVIAYSPDHALPNSLHRRNYSILQMELTNEVTAQYQRGYALLREEQYEEAREAFRQLLDIYPETDDSVIVDNVNEHARFVRSRIP